MPAFCEGHAAIDERQLDIFDGGCARKQIESLKHETEKVPAQERTLAACQRANVDALEEYDPEVGVSRQPMMFIAVDLPEPDGPMMATNSPLPTLRSAPASACTAASPDPYTLVMAFSSIKAAGLSLDFSTADLTVWPLCYRRSRPAHPEVRL